MLNGEAIGDPLQVSWARGVLRFAAQAVACGPSSGIAEIDAHRRDIHSMRGNWAMPSLGQPPPGFSYCLLVHRLLLYARLTAKSAEVIPLSQVCFKVGRLSTFKFATADVSCPCFAVATHENPARRRE